MSSSATLALIIIPLFVFAFIPDQCRTQDLEAETQTEGNLTEYETTTIVPVMVEQDESDTGDKLGFIDMEIISLDVESSTGNAVQLSWGRPTPEYNLNWTYGLYYGTSLDDLEEPKLRTKELCVVVRNLTFCTQYVFGVGVVDPETGIGKRPNNIRRISTFIDPRAAPQNLHVEFIPQEHPALLINWSASCPNVGLPLSYNVYVYEKNPTHTTISTTPRTTSADLSHILRDIIYGQTYSIKVSADYLRANSTELISYKAPLFLQPFRIRVTADPDGTFLIYWREPYVPFYVGPYYYEVFAYPGRGLREEYQVFRTRKSVVIFKGNYSEYTIMLGLRSERGDYSSFLTEPLWKSLYGGEAERIDEQK